MVSAADAQRLEACLRRGGVALFGADTVYGLACDPEQAPAVNRLYALKGRPTRQPAAVMFFSLAAALAELPELAGRPELAERPELGERSHLERVIRRLLPGPFTLLLPNPRRRFALACGPTPEVLGLRVPHLSAAAQALAGLSRPVLQSSANPSGGPDARRLADVDQRLREQVDLVLDAGELPGVPSTVVDLRGGPAHDPQVVREGAVSRVELARILDRDGGVD